VLGDLLDFYLGKENSFGQRKKNQEISSPEV